MRHLFPSDGYSDPRKALLPLEQGRGRKPPRSEISHQSPHHSAWAMLVSSNTALSSVTRSIVLLLPPKRSGRSIQQEVIHLVEQAKDGYLSEDNTRAESFGKEATGHLPSLASCHGRDNLITRENELPKSAGERTRILGFFVLGLIFFIRRADEGALC